MSINNDTIYSMAQLDLSGGPVRLRVPDTAGRYYVLQFVDAWTNNFAYVGHRATGTEAGTFLLVPPGWDGSSGDGERGIRVPTDVASIVGRWAVAGEQDMPVVLELQAGLTLEATGLGRGLPEPAAAHDDLGFFEQLRDVDAGVSARATRSRVPAAVLAARAPRSRATVRRSRSRAGRRPGRGEAAHGSARSPGAESRAERLEAQPTTLSITTWTSSRSARSTTSAVEAGRPDQRAYVQTGVGRSGRAVGQSRLRGHLRRSSRTTARASNSTGNQRYAIRFDTAPPVNGFWSLTMYDMPAYYLVDNPINRYSIRRSHPRASLHGPDGSLTILLQHDPPSDPDDRAELAPNPRRRRSDRSYECTSLTRASSTAATRSPRSSASPNRRPAANTASRLSAILIIAIA